MGTCVGVGGFEGGVVGGIERGTGFRSEKTSTSAVTSPSMPGERLTNLSAYKTDLTTNSSRRGS